MKRALLLVGALLLGVAAGEWCTGNFGFRAALGRLVRHDELVQLVGTRGIYSRDPTSRGRAIEELVSEAKIANAAAGERVNNAALQHELDLLRAPLPNEKAWDGLLTNAGLSPAGLRREVAENLRGRSWLEARVAAAAKPPNDQEIRTLFRRASRGVSAAGTLSREPPISRGARWLPGRSPGGERAADRRARTPAAKRRIVRCPGRRIFRRRRNEKARRRPRLFQRRADAPGTFRSCAKSEGRRNEHADSQPARVPSSAGHGGVAGARDEPARSVAGDHRDTQQHAARGRARPAPVNRCAGSAFGCACFFIRFSSQH